MAGFPASGVPINKTCLVILLATLIRHFLVGLNQFHSRTTVPALLFFLFGLGLLAYAQTSTEAGAEDLDPGIPMASPLTSG